MRSGLLFLLLPAFAYADAGILIPSTRQQPDATILSLEEMWIDVHIDERDARVSVRQIFASHSGGVLEGNYIFALPGSAAVSDFAVWDDVTRIPGVILERRRAEEIYQQARMQAIDPGLLQMGERGADEARRSAVFSARIVPIPAFGTKRLELEYHESIPVEDLQSLFAIPLRPDAYQAQKAALLHIDFELRSALPLASFEVTGKTYPLRIAEKTANLVRGSFEGHNVAFTEDFAVRYTVEPARERLEIATHRDSGEPGFFQASALVAQAPGEGAGDAGAPRTVVALFDNSLSMQWEKLDRNFQALETLLKSLRPRDRFNVLLFNSDVARFSPEPVRAEIPAVEKALDFVKASRLRGGTDLERALDTALGQAGDKGSEPYLVLLTDGNSTRGRISNRAVSDAYAAKWKRAPAGRAPRTYVFAVGDDANLPLLRTLAAQDGLIEWVRSTEPVEFKLKAFLAKLGRRPVESLALTSAPAGNFDMVYPLSPTIFTGSVASWVGQYKQPGSATFAVRGVRAGKPFEVRSSAALPAQNAEHPQLPRSWARARVDALLALIDRNGEDQASIDEIIRLARKYKFVTPYTSFLAAPRALLRPRLIRPGDPVLRVRTDPSIVSVVALFPFGTVKQLRYLAGEDIWQTRFLAPAAMEDGVYQVRLILRDREGRAIREAKTFVIAGKPPVVRARAGRRRLHRGESVHLAVSASQTTRTVMARMYGASPVSLRWDPRAGANTGELLIPPNLPAGNYVITVTAEDIAHNIGSQEVPLEVLP